jgi:hypothetical protein
MRFWTVPVVLLILTASSQAQIPIYGGYFQPYYPGAYAPPYFPQAYYPQPYIFPPSVPTPYVPTPYVPPAGYWPPEVTVRDNTNEVDSLNRQVQTLNDEVRMLQSQLTVAQTQVQTQAEALARAEAESPREPSPPSTVLVLKNGQRIKTQGYALSGDTLWIITPSGRQRMSLSNVNVEATRRANQ